MCSNSPGESSDTGVLDGDGLCPGGRKCDGDPPLLEPPPAPENSESSMKSKLYIFKLSSFINDTYPDACSHAVDCAPQNWDHPTAFHHRHQVLVRLSSSFYTLIDDFETIFLPASKQRCTQKKRVKLL
jgi:hypothetical protein